MIVKLLVKIYLSLQQYLFFVINGQTKYLTEFSLVRHRKETHANLMLKLCPLNNQILHRKRFKN